VLSASVASSSFAADAVPACVNAAVQRWSFPGCDSASDVTYPFVFLRSE
jgi:hypothetical protein